MAHEKMEPKAAHIVLSYTKLTQQWQHEFSNTTVCTQYTDKQKDELKVNMNQSVV